MSAVGGILPLGSLPQLKRKQTPLKMKIDGREVPAGTWVFQWSDTKKDEWHLPNSAELKRYDEAPLESIRPPFQILMNAFNNNRSYVIDNRGIKRISGEPPVSDAEKQVIKNLSVEDTQKYVEQYRKMLGLPYGDPKLEALIDWIDSIVGDREAKERADSLLRIKEMATATEKFYEENLPNTWVCKTCKRLVARESLYKHKFCPGCGAKIEQ